MQGEGPFLAIAEIAIALAGFASIVVAIRGTSGTDWTWQDRFGLANVFAPSVGVFVCALVPFPLHHLGMTDDSVWRLSSGLYGSLTLCYVTFLSIRQWGISPRVPLVYWFFISSGYVLCALLICMALGVVFDPGPWLLLLGFVWALTAALAQMATFLLLATVHDKTHPPDD